MAATHSRLARAAIAAAAILVAPAAPGRPARAQLLEDSPEELRGIGIVERLDAPLPLDLTFRDEEGRDVALRSFFRPGRPVALNLVYFDCPMLCNVFLDGFVAGLRDLDWTPGREFEVVTVSIDPRDGPEGAARKRAHYVERLGRPEAASGWHFLTGTEASVKELADSLGFAYRLLEDRGEYAHSAGLFVATPGGRLSRTVTGVVFEPRTLRLALVEASDGKIGSPVDQLLLFCFAYDHTAGRYGPTALRLVRLFGLLTAVALAAFLWVSARRDARRQRAARLGASS
jgi:protein SCO1/2